MKNKKKLLVLLLVLIVAVGGASVGYKRLAENYEQAEENTAVSPEEKIKAPDFTAFDGEMNEVRLYDYIGKPIVLNFWATWCGPCKAEMPYFNEAYNEYKDDVNILMVNLTDGERDTVEGVKKFIGDAGYSFPVLYDTEYIAANTYGTYSIPVTFFIDAEGNAINMHRGSMSREMLYRYIENLIKDK